MTTFVLISLMATLASAGVAFLFFRAYIIEHERRKHDKAYIRQLREMLRNRDHLSDPAHIDRVLDAFERRGPVAVPDGAGDGDSRGASEPVA